MCVAVPTKVVSVQDNTAVVDLSGARRSVSLLLMEDKVNIGLFMCLFMPVLQSGKSTRIMQKRPLSLLIKMYDTEEKFD